MLCLAELGGRGAFGVMLVLHRVLGVCLDACDFRGCGVSRSLSSSGVPLSNFDTNLSSAVIFLSGLAGGDVDMERLSAANFPDPKRNFPSAPSCCACEELAPTVAGRGGKCIGVEALGGNGVSDGNCAEPGELVATP